MHFLFVFLISYLKDARTAQESRSQTTETTQANRITGMSLDVAKIGSVEIFHLKLDLIQSL